MLKQIEDIELGERGCMWVWVGGEIGIDTIKFYYKYMDFLTKIDKIHISKYKVGNAIQKIFK